MALDPGSLVVAGGALVTAIGAWFTLRAQTSDHEKRVTALDLRVDGIEKAHADFRLIVSQDYVRNTAMREMEARLVKGMDELGHIVRGTMKEIYAALMVSGRAPKRRAGADDTDS